MTTEQLHTNLTILINAGVSKAEIARRANVERANLSKWLNHYNRVYMSQETLNRLQQAVISIYSQLTNIVL